MIHGLVAGERALCWHEQRQRIRIAHNSSKVRKNDHEED